jgi:ABC-type phosphate/phosphonate transport system substrate-binding protein
MRSNLRIVLVRTAMVLSLVVGSVAAQAEIRLAILPRLSAVELNKMFTPLADYLSRETGEKVILVIPKDFDAFKSVVQSGQADLGFANSLVYVQLRKGVSIEPLALAAEPKAGTRFRGVIIARRTAASGISRISREAADLRGEDSAAGHVFQMFCSQ